MTALADFKEGIIYASIDIAASPDAVWSALTEPAQLTSWWGSSDTYRTFDWEVDLRPGGKWSSKAASVDGSNVGTVHGEYLQVEPPRLLVYSWIPSWDNFAETLIRVELSATPQGTHVKVRHSGFADRTVSGTGHAEGWKRVLGWLAGHAALRSPA
jgi:uncharacterized protein YndB with AHSA1/START domain